MRIFLFISGLMGFVLASTFAQFNTNPNNNLGYANQAPNQNYPNLVSSQDYVKPGVQVQNYPNQYSGNQNAYPPGFVPNYVQQQPNFPNVGLPSSPQENHMATNQNYLRQGSTGNQNFPNLGLPNSPQEVMSTNQNYLRQGGSDNQVDLSVKRMWDGLIEEASDAIKIVSDYLKSIKFNKLGEVFNGLKQEAANKGNILLQKVLNFIEMIVQTIRSTLSVLTSGLSDRFIDSFEKIFSYVKQFLEKLRPANNF